MGGRGTAPPPSQPQPWQQEPAAQPAATAAGGASAFAPLASAPFASMDGSQSGVLVPSQGAAQAAVHDDGQSLSQLFGPPSNHASQATGAAAWDTAAAGTALPGTAFREASGALFASQSLPHASASFDGAPPQQQQQQQPWGGMAAHALGGTGSSGGVGFEASSELSFTSKTSAATTGAATAAGAARQVPEPHLSAYGAAPVAATAFVEVGNSVAALFGGSADDDPFAGFGAADTAYAPPQPWQASPPAPLQQQAYAAAPGHGYDNAWQQQQQQQQQHVHGSYEHDAGYVQQQQPPQAQFYGAHAGQQVPHMSHGTPPVPTFGAEAPANMSHADAAPGLPFGALLPGGALNDDGTSFFASIEEDKAAQPSFAAPAHQPPSQQPQPHQVPQQQSSAVPAASTWQSTAAVAQPQPWQQPLSPPQQHHPQPAVPWQHAQPLQHYAAPVAAAAAPFSAGPFGAASDDGTSFFEAAPDEPQAGHGNSTAMSVHDKCAD